MAEITLEKNHALLEKLAEYVMNEVSTKQEVDEKIDKLAEYVMNEVPTKREVDTKIDKLAEYVINEMPTRQEMKEEIERLANYLMNEIPTKHEMREELEKKADKKDIQKILDGQDVMVNQLDIIRTEQYAFNAAFTRIEERVESLESEI